MVEWFAFFGCGVDIKTRDYQARIKRIEGSILREISVNRIVIGQGHAGRVIIVPPRGKNVPEGSDMLAFYKHLLYGLLQFTYMTGATVNLILALKNLSRVVQDVMVLLNWNIESFMFFLWASDGRTYNAAIVNLWSQSLQDETSDVGFWKDLDT